jgi:hypothetical protein
MRPPAGRSGLNAGLHRTIDYNKHKGTIMKSTIKAFLAGSVLAIASMAAAAAMPDPVVGTWTMNAAKSKFSPGHEIKSQTRTYTESSDGVTLQVTGVAGDGTPIAQKVTFKYDGTSYPISGAADYDALSVKRVNGSTVNSTMMKGGKPVGTAVRSISMHGKVLTLTSKLKGADGKRYSMTLVFDKQ